MKKTKNILPGSPRPVAEIVLRCRQSVPPRSLAIEDIPRLIAQFNAGDDGAFRKIFNNLLPMICAKIANLYQDGENILNHLFRLENCLRNHLILPGDIDCADEGAWESYLERVVDGCLAEVNS